MGLLKTDLVPWDMMYTRAMQPSRKEMIATAKNNITNAAEGLRLILSFVLKLVVIF
jgi:hypothetical protein